MKMLNNKTLGMESRMVFISHASADREFVEKEIIAVLHQHGIQTWYSPLNITGSMQWRDEIAKAVKNCDDFLIVLSKKSVKSEWVKTEIGLAFEYKRRIIPVQLHKLDFVKLVELDPRLPQIQYIDYRRDVEKARQKLLSQWGVSYSAETGPTPGYLESSNPINRLKRHIFTLTKAQRIALFLLVLCLLCTPLFFPATQPGIEAAGQAGPLAQASSPTPSVIPSQTTELSPTSTSTRRRSKTTTSITSTAFVTSTPALTSTRMPSQTPVPGSAFLPPSQTSAPKHTFKASATSSRTPAPSPTLMSTPTPLPSATPVASCQTDVDFGGVNSCSINPVSDIDTFSFTGEGQLIISSVTINGDLETAYELTQQDGAPVADCSDSNPYIKTFCTLPNAGTYSLHVHDRNSSHSGDYRLYIQQLGDPGDATAVSLGAAPVSAEIKTRGQFDTYTFNAQAGWVHIVVQRNAGTLEPMFGVYQQPDGALICRDESSDNLNEAFMLSNAGTYTLIIADRRGETTGTYSLSITQSFSGQSCPTPIPPG
jgi:hypothetical protein